MEVLTVYLSIKNRSNFFVKFFSLNLTIETNTTYASKQIFMELIFKSETPSRFSTEEKNDFLKLLIHQNQVANPNLEKINSSSFICIVYGNNIPIGIGAVKNVYKAPFNYADVEKLKGDFDNELGYLYVVDDINSSFRGLGIGKTICKLLLKHIGNINVFATTHESDDNVAKHILQSLKFMKVGNTYEGHNTGKEIGLYIKKAAIE